MINKVFKVDEDLLETKKEHQLVQPKNQNVKL